MSKISRIGKREKLQKRQQKRRDIFEGILMLMLTLTMVYMGEILNLVLLNWGTMISKKIFLIIKQAEEEDKGLVEIVIRWKTNDQKVKEDEKSKNGHPKTSKGWLQVMKASRKFYF
jgi:hypothetical protein